MLLQGSLIPRRLDPGGVFFLNLVRRTRTLQPSSRRKPGSSASRCHEASASLAVRRHSRERGNRFGLGFLLEERRAHTFAAVGRSRYPRPKHACKAIPGSSSPASLPVTVLGRGIGTDAPPGDRLTSALSCAGFRNRVTDAPPHDHVRARSSQHAAGSKGQFALWIARLSTERAASCTASDRVGCAWQIRARSSAEPWNSIATTASAINSE